MTKASLRVNSQKLGVEEVKTQIVLDRIKEDTTIIFPEIEEK